MSENLYFDICDSIIYLGYVIVKDNYGYWSVTDENDNTLIEKWSYWKNLEELKKDINDFHKPTGEK
jgi:hypothetical protein